MTSAELPITRGVLRFAIGHPDRISSNSWRVWTSKSGDIYVACRDNYRETKISLHASDRWRFGFTSEAVTRNPAVIDIGGNRAWEVWNRPEAILPGATAAFRLMFFTCELAVTPTMRPENDWKNVIFIEAAPNDGVNVVTIWVTEGNPRLRYGAGRSITLASLPLKNDQQMQVTVHGDFDPSRQDWLQEAIAAAMHMQREKRLPTVLEGGRLLLFGQSPDGARFITEANAPVDRTMETGTDAT